MSTLKSNLITGLKMMAAASLLAVSTTSKADPTFWTGSTTSFSHSPGGPPDQWTSNHTGADSVNNVWISRGARQALFNAAAEPGWNAGYSPSNTMWVVASGPLTSANTLTYDTFANAVGQPGNSPGRSVGQTFFVHILPDDIYLQLTLTEWGNNDGGSFSYDRTTPAAVTPPPTPTVGLTNPAPGAVFASPAALKLGATASVSGGTVTNVQFFANSSTSLGAVISAPFNLTSSSLTAGTYALTAVATAAGVSATSSVVNVSVVTPVNVSASAARITSGQFSFSYSVNTGLTYVVQNSSNLLNWVSLATNTPSANPASFSTSIGPKGAAFYRIGRQPNP